MLIRAHGGATTRLGRGSGVAGRRGRGGAGARRGRAARRRRLGLVAALRGEIVGAEVPRGPIKGRAGSGRPCRGARLGLLAWRSFGRGCARDWADLGCRGKGLS